MTDYGKPATPQDVCQRIHDDLMRQVERIRRDADIQLARASALEQAAWDVDQERRSYEQWQPKSEAVDNGHAETPEIAAQNGSTTPGGEQ